jgi:hypothetical protein
MAVAEATPASAPTAHRAAFEQRARVPDAAGHLRDETTHVDVPRRSGTFVVADRFARVAELKVRVPSPATDPAVLETSARMVRPRRELRHATADVHVASQSRRFVVADVRGFRSRARLGRRCRNSGRCRSRAGRTCDTSATAETLPPMSTAERRRGLSSPIVPVSPEPCTRRCPNSAGCVVEASAGVAHPARDSSPPALTSPPPRRLPSPPSPGRPNLRLRRLRAALPPRRPCPPNPNPPRPPAPVPLSQPNPARRRIPPLPVPLVPANRHVHEVPLLVEGRPIPTVDRSARTSSNGLIGVRPPQLSKATVSTANAAWPRRHHESLHPSRSSW